MESDREGAVGPYLDDLRWMVLIEAKNRLLWVVGDQVHVNGLESMEHIHDERIKIATEQRRPSHI